MRTTRIAFIALAFAVFMAGSTSAWAQDPAPAPAPAAPAQEKAPEQAKAKTMTATGELIKVDTEKKTLSVRQADGAELTFSYNDQTEITGEQKGAQGLATAQGSRVIVQYTTTDSTKTATKIEVKAAKK
jgi:hypothetical protein